MTSASQHRYDVFVSHSSAQKPWVEVLARNLTRAGLRVFLDRWELVPGKDWVEGLDQALKASKAAVLVMSPEAYHSGWVGREYRTLLARTIPIVPVVFGAVEAAFPFAESIHWVDFRSPHDYREAFARLLCGLRGEAPGPEPTWTGELDLPEEPLRPRPARRTTAREVFEQVRASRIALVLGRDGQDLARIAAVLSKEARQDFAASRIRILNLPVTGGPGDDGAVFRTLSRDAGLESEAESGTAFQAAVAASLRTMPGAWLWLVFGFENLSVETRETLAGIMRALGVGHGDFQVVLLGGERLHALSYGNGALSIFFGAAEVWWPDPKPDELAGNRPVDPAQLARVMALTGGQPLLTRELLSEDGDDQTLSAVLRDHPLLVRTIATLSVDARRRLRMLAAQDDIGPFTLIHAEPVIRGLWWRNLIRRDPKTRRLCWRSPTIREGLSEVLEALGGIGSVAGRASFHVGPKAHTVSVSEESRARMPADRVKVRFESTRVMQSALRLETPGMVAGVVSQRRNFLAVQRPPGMSADQFQAGIHRFVQNFGAEITADHQHILDAVPTFGTGMLDDPEKADATLDDVLRCIGVDRIGNRAEGQGVVIAVVDKGVNGKRPEFPESRRVAGWAPPGQEPWSDDCGHGTMCACIAAATRAARGRFQGVAPKAGLISCRSELYDTELAEIYDTLADRAKTGEVIVATNSYGDPYSVPLDPDTLAALDHAIAAGVYFVFSAGNNHETVGGKPDSCGPNSIWQHKGRADVLTVATSTLEGEMWHYSSRGPGEFLGQENTSPKPDVTAPTPRNGLILYGEKEVVSSIGWGTSGAAPQVAGLLALLLSLDKTLPRGDLFDLVRSTAKRLELSHECRGQCQGHGIIDCSAAVDRLRVRKGG
jgi:serine protease AprX